MVGYIQNRSQFLLEQVRPEKARATLVDEEIIFGRDSEMGTLTEILLNEGGQELDVYYLSVVGMGGMGKTALVKSVYNSFKVQEKFEQRVWILVSVELSLTMLLKEIIESVTSYPVQWNEVELDVLVRLFYQTIEEKRYLFVLDDVSDKNWSHWKEVKDVFKCGAPGSAVLVITRARDVAIAAKSSYIMYLGPLSEEYSWLMLRYLAFRTLNDEKTTKTFLRDVGRQIVKRCRGVPLSIKAIASTSLEDWKPPLKDRTKTFPETEETSRESLESSRDAALQLSYNQLPDKWRECLLYCSIFPKNHPVDVHKLIKLWMAQSYFDYKGDEMEREGKRCFDVLLSRSFFEKDGFDDKGNLLYKMNSASIESIQKLAIDICNIINVNEEVEEDLSSKKVHHWTLNVANRASIPISTRVPSPEKVHTLMIVSECSFIEPMVFSSLLRDFRGLKALGLSNCLVSEVPSTIGKLLLLRYLDFSFNCDLKKLPEEICNLSLLQTLNLNGCVNLQNLPNGIGKLMQLRHLEILWTRSLSYLPKGIRRLTSLRTLNRFFGSGVVGNEACDLGDLGELRNLEGYISMDGLGDVTDVALAEKAGLKNKERLHGVDLWFSGVASDCRNHAEVLKFLEPPPNLKCLGIFHYKNESFPDWMTTMAQLRQLRHLILSDCSGSAILPPLGKLPVLESLEIRNMINVKKVGPEFLGIESDHGHAGEVVSTIRPDSRDGSHDVTSAIRANSDENWKQVVSFNAGSSNGKEIMPVSNDVSKKVISATGSTSHGGSYVLFPKLDRLHFHKLTNWEEWDEINGRAENIMPRLSSLSIVKCRKLRAVPDYIKRKEDLRCHIAECSHLMKNRQQSTELRREDEV